MIVIITIKNNKNNVMIKIIKTMINNNSYKSNINDKKKFNSITEEVFFVTQKILGLYPSIPQEINPESLQKVLNIKTKKKIATEYVMEMDRFVLENINFEFNRKAN